VSDGELAGQTALVTGASRGIGLAIARALVESGARVAMLARSADVLAREAAALGPRAFPVPCDVGVAEQVDRAVKLVRGALSETPDVLVNNAGAFVLAAVGEMTPADFAATMSVNLVAPYRILHAFLPAMRRRGAGHVVTIGSIADRVTFAENGAYAASKFGARALHEVMRSELGGTGVRTTLVSPGPVDTAIWDAIDPDTRPGFTPRASMLGAAAVADAVLWAVTRPADINIDELRLSRA
jgi:NADP-dependent 3-hydroxy acid dehydrogenase YdfG